MGPSSKCGEKNTAGAYHDVRLARRFKRRRVAEGLNLNASNEDNVNKNTVRRNFVLDEEVEGDGEIIVDSDYGRFLSDLGHSDWGNVYTDSGSVDDEETGADYPDPHNNMFEDGADHSDPQYKMFLEMLRVDGNSYVLEIPLSGDMSLVIKYEKEVGSFDGRGLQNLDVLRQLLGGVNMKGDKNLRDPSETDRVDGRFQAPFNSVEHCEGYIRNGTGCSHVRPIRKSPNLVKQKRSHSITRDGVHESCQVHFNSLKRDGDTELSKREKNLSNVSKRGRMETQDKSRDSGLLKCEKSLRGVLKRARVDSQKNLPDSGQFNSTKTFRVVSKRDRMEDNLIDIGGTEMEDNLRDFGGTERESPLNMKSNNEKVAENSHKKPTQKKDHFVDESYHVFLNSLKKVVDPTLVKQKFDTEVKIEDDESSSDSEVIVISEDPFIQGYRTPFVTSKFKDAPIDVDNDTEDRRQGKPHHSQFREKLMDVLTKPFDQKEYEELHKDINAERTREGIRRLRGREVAYSLGSCAPSYLDLHSDLKMKIDSFRNNPHKVLILLRGFFFWLENIILDGSFQPWKDPTCSELLSQP